MMMRVYVVRDEVGRESSNLFEAKNDQVALRQYNRLMASSEFAAEFALWCVGTHEREIGLLVAFGEPMVVDTSVVDASSEEDE